jgi:toxin secretion/phage lysis holin
MKNAICTSIGLIGSLVASLFGGWTASLTTLLIFMGIDYVSGLIVAGVFHKSPKTETGALESRAGLKGLIRKFYVLLFVLIGYRLDVAVGTTYIRDAVCIAFIANELISMYCSMLVVNRSVNGDAPDWLSTDSPVSGNISL